MRECVVCCLSAQFRMCRWGGLVCLFLCGSSSSIVYVCSLVVLCVRCSLSRGGCVLDTGGGREVDQAAFCGAVGRKPRVLEGGLV